MMAETHTASTVPPVRLARFDSLVGVAVAVLIVAIAFVILLGDRVGVQIERYSPIGETSSTTDITLTFSEAMNWDTLIDHIQFTPDLAGDYRWSNKTLRFTPAQPLQSDTAYTVTVGAGAESAGRRQVLHDTDFSFRVRSPRVAYLSPADAVPQNIWLAEPGVEGSAEQITFSPTGITTFDVSPDGMTIAFSENNSQLTSDLKLLDINTGAIRQVTNCLDSECNTPVWRPDGTMIAYHRIDFNSDFTELGVSPTRVWIVDLTTSPPVDRPLFSDNQILGYGPQWSADSSRVSIYDSRSKSILVYDFLEDNIVKIPGKDGGSVFAMSPDGERIVFNTVTFGDAGSMRSTLRIADLETNEVRDLTDLAAPVDDTQSAWNPDGRYLVVARRYTDERATRTRQLFLLDTETGGSEPLVYDEQYYNGFFTWHPRGNKLAFYRFPDATDADPGSPPPRPEVWTYDMADNMLVRIAENAYFPDWVP